MQEVIKLAISTRISDLLEEIQDLENQPKDPRTAYSQQRQLEVLKSTLQTNLDLLSNLTTTIRH